MSRVRLAAQDELWEGELRAIVADGVPLLLARIDGKVCAWLDRCPHLGSRLSAGRLEGSVVTCPSHHWQFDLTDGRGINPATARLTAVPLETRDGELVACLDGAHASPARVVGPVLLRSPAARALADAICTANPAARIDFHGAYLRVCAPAPCVVTREQIEARLGDTFVLPGDLERTMPSYQGRLSMSEGEVRWD